LAGPPVLRVWTSIFKLQGLSELAIVALIVPTIVTLIQHFIALVYWFDDFEEGKNWPKNACRWTVQASHALLSSCPQTNRFVGLQMSSGFAERSFFQHLTKTSPPCPAKVIFGCSSEVPNKLLHFRQRTSMQAFLNLFMSINVGERF
jgi:hypothetical protein